MRSHTDPLPRRPLLRLVFDVLHGNEAIGAGTDAEHRPLVPDPLHVRPSGRFAGVRRHPACGRAENEDAAVSEQVQRLVVGGGVRAHQLRATRLLQRDGAAYVAAHDDGSDGVDGVRAAVQVDGAEIGTGGGSGPI